MIAIGFSRKFCTETSHLKNRKKNRMNFIHARFCIFDPMNVKAFFFFAKNVIN